MQPDALVVRLGFKIPVLGFILQAFRESVWQRHIVIAMGERLFRDLHRISLSKRQISAGFGDDEKARTF